VDQVHASIVFVEGTLSAAAEWLHKPGVVLTTVCIVLLCIPRHTHDMCALGACMKSARLKRAASTPEKAGWWALLLRSIELFSLHQMFAGH